MHIVAFWGSTSSTSINKKLVLHTLRYFPDAKVTLLDLSNYEMPIFSVNSEKGGYPEAAYQFHREFKQADLILCSMAEHNRSYTAAFKNILDWCSRVDMNIFKNKPMFLMSTSPGGYGGGNVMNAASGFFPKCGAEVIQTFSLPSFNVKFSETDGILDNDLAIAHKNSIDFIKSRFTDIQP